jgi:hypothetical protein
MNQNTGAETIIYKEKTPSKHGDHTGTLPYARNPLFVSFFSKVYVK